MAALSSHSCFLQCLALVMQTDAGLGATRWFLSSSARRVGVGGKRLSDNAALQALGTNPDSFPLGSWVQLLAPARQPGACSHPQRSVPLVLKIQNGAASGMQGQKEPL